MSGLEIMGVHHSDAPNGRKWMQLVASQKISQVIYASTLRVKSRVLAEQRRQETILIKAMRRLGVHALKRINPAWSSVHYAGTLPFSTEENRLLCTEWPVAWHA